MTRRIVTGNNAEGKSYFVHGGPSSTRLNMGKVVNEQFRIDDPANPDPTETKAPGDVDPSTYTRLSTARSSELSLYSPRLTRHTSTTKSWLQTVPEPIRVAHLKRTIRACTPHAL